MNHKYTYSLNFMSTHITQKYGLTFDQSDRLYYLYTNPQILNNPLQTKCDPLVFLLLNMQLLGFLILP